MTADSFDTLRYETSGRKAYVTLDRPVRLNAISRGMPSSVGPAVSEELQSHGLRTDIYPANDAFFMKPLISAMATALTKAPPRARART